MSKPIDSFKNIYDIYFEMHKLMAQLHISRDFEVLQEFLFKHRDIKESYEKLRKMYVLDSEKKDKTEYDKGVQRGLYLALQIFEDWGDED